MSFSSADGIYRPLPQACVAVHSVECRQRSWRSASCRRQYCNWIWGTLQVGSRPGAWKVKKAFDTKSRGHIRLVQVLFVDSLWHHFRNGLHASFESYELYSSQGIWRYLMRPHEHLFWCQSLYYEPFPDPMWEFPLNSKSWHHFPLLKWLSNFHPRQLKTVIFGDLALL